MGVAGWTSQGDQGPSEEALAQLRGGQVEAPLVAVGGPAARDADELGAELFGLCPSPASRQPAPEHVEELVGEPAQGPEQSIAVEVVHGGLAHRQLGQFLDALFEHTAGVVAPAGGQSMDARDVGQDVGRVGHLVSVQREGPFRLRQGTESFGREESGAPEAPRVRVDFGGLGKILSVRFERR